MGNPLPEELISKDELGKLKFEYKVREGIFNAPKSYWLDAEGEKDVLVQLRAMLAKNGLSNNMRINLLQKMVVVLLPCTIENINNTKARIIIYTGNAFLYQKRKRNHHLYWECLPLPKEKELK
jgi:hypothetical protein